MLLAPSTAALLCLVLGRSAAQPTTTSSGLTQDHTRMQRHPDIDLNQPPAMHDHAQPAAQGAVRGDLAGSMGRGLRGWKRKQERTERVFIPDPVTIELSSSPSERSDVEDDKAGRRDGQRLRRPSNSPSSKSQPASSGLMEGQQRRIMPPRQAKGKAAVPSHASSSSDHSSRGRTPSSSTFISSPSSSASEHFKSDGQFSDSPKGSKKTKVHHLIKQTSMTSSPFHPGTSRPGKAPARVWKNYYEGSRTHQLEIQRKKFYKEWDKVPFDPKGDPKEMATRVAAMHVEGMADDNLGRRIASEIKNGADREYHDEYLRHLGSIRMAMRRAEKKLQPQGVLDGMDGRTRKQHLLNVALSRRSQGTRLLGKKRRPKQIRRLQAHMDKIEQAAREHLAGKKMDFDQISPAKVEEEMRDFDHKQHGLNVSQHSFIEGLYAMLRKKKGATEIDMSRIIGNRRDHRYRAYNHSRAMKKAGQTSKKM